jgi:hypothetical protein
MNLGEYTFLEGEESVDVSIQSGSIQAVEADAIVVNLFQGVTGG